MIRTGTTAFQDMYLLEEEGDDVGWWEIGEYSKGTYYFFSKYRSLEDAIFGL